MPTKLAAEIRIAMRGLYFLLACFAKAQYRFDSWTTDNGLPQNSVYSMALTGDGYLWLMSLDGLIRFDGVRFTIFNKTNSKNLPTSRFVRVFAETDGTLWAGRRNTA